MSEETSYSQVFYSNNEWLSYLRLQSFYLVYFNSNVLTAIFREDYDRQY